MNEIGGSNVVKNLARNKMQRYFSNFQNLYLLFVQSLCGVVYLSVDVGTVCYVVYISVLQKEHVLFIFQSSAYNGLIRLVRFQSF